MNRWISRLSVLMVTLFLSQSAFAFILTSRQKLQVDVLVLDAIMGLANMGTSGYMYAAAAANPDLPNNHDALVKAANFQYINSIFSAAQGAAFDGCPTCSALEWVSQSYTPWWQIPIMGIFADHEDGFSIARRAAMAAAQTAHPATWGPDVIWNMTTPLALSALKQNTPPEEFGPTTARVVWQYVLSLSDKIGKDVRAQVHSGYLPDKFDGKQLLIALKKPIDTPEFQRAIPEAQAFYKGSVDAVEKKLQAQGYLN